MKIHEYNQMMSWLTRAPNKYSKEEKKKIVEDFYKKAEQPKSKPMPIVKYINRMNELYGNGKTDEYGNKESATDRIRDPKFFQNKLKNIQKKEPVKIAKKPTVLQLLEFEDYLNTLDPNWMNEEAESKPDDDKTRLRKKIIKTGIKTLV
jgi:hypothetical protein